MTHEEIYNVLKTTGLPVVYAHYRVKQTPDLPYIVFDYPTRSDEYADNQNYAHIVDMEVYLYTPEKDLELEHDVETVLSQYWTYAKQSDYYDGEDVQETIYMVQAVLHESTN